MHSTFPAYSVKAQPPTRLHYTTWTTCYTHEFTNPVARLSCFLSVTLLSLRLVPLIFLLSHFLSPALPVDFIYHPVLSTLLLLSHFPIAPFHCSILYALYMTPVFHVIDVLRTQTFPLWLISF